MSINIQEAGLYDVLSAGSLEAITHARAMIDVNNLTEQSVTDAIAFAANTAVYTTLKTFDDFGFVTEVIDGGIGEIVDQDMAKQWAALINS
ncbi:hypothetical protein [Pseudomonas phage D6]|nr:hypothetical protein [Pseudomonas phage D6]